MEKMLVIVVDGSLYLASYWKDIKPILESIVRKFCADDASTSSQDQVVRNYNLNLIVNAAKDDSAGTNLDSFLNSLSCLKFNDDGHESNSGIIDGLTTALKMFPSTPKQQQTQLLGKQHCVLVTASHPTEMPNKVIDARMETVLAAAEPVARSFKESLVSLSIICSWNMPMLRTIYDAGNHLTESSTMALKHPQLLLFISEQFQDARIALKQFQADNQQDYSQLPLAESISSEELMWVQDNMPILADDEIERLLNEPGLEGDTPEEREGFNTLISANPCPSEVVNSNLSASSTNMNLSEQRAMDNLLSFQQNNSFGNSMDVHTLTRTTTSCVDNPSQRTILKPNNTFHLSISWIEKNYPLWNSEAPNHPSQKPISKQNNTFHLSTSWLDKNDPLRLLKSSNPKVFAHARRLENIPISNTQTFSGNTSGWTYASSFNRKTAGIDSMMAISNAKARMATTSINTRNAGIIINGTKEVLNMKTATSSTNDALNASYKNGASASNSSLLKVPQFFGAKLLPNYYDDLIPNAQSSDHNLPRYISPNIPYGHIKAWEGSIASRGSGVTLFISKLVAYRKPAVPEKIFGNWPKMMQLNHLLPLMYLPNSLNLARKEYLSFSVLDSCPIWDHMKAKSLCAYVDLPGQTLILWISENETRLMGMLCEGIVPAYSDPTFKLY